MFVGSGLGRRRLREDGGKERGFGARRGSTLASLNIYSSDLAVCSQRQCINSRKCHRHYYRHNRL